MTAELKIVGPGVNEDAVSLLEETLARVRSGETISIGIVETHRNRGVSTTYTSPPGGSYHLLNSGAARLAARLANMDGD